MSPEDTTTIRYVRNLGRVRYVNRSAYDAATAYVPRDLVYYNACVYENVVACANVPPTDTAHWRVFVDTRGAAYEWAEY